MHKSSCCPENSQHILLATAALGSYCLRFHHCTFSICSKIPNEFVANNDCNVECGLITRHTLDHLIFHYT